MRPGLLSIVVQLLDYSEHCKTTLVNTILVRGNYYVVSRTSCYSTQDLE